MEVFTDWNTWQRAEPELRRLLPASTCDEVAKAVAYATRCHGDQRRPTGAPYTEHLLEALEFLVRGAGVTDPEVLSAAVLHDVVEDTPASIDDVRSAFGDRVAELVGWVTIPERGEDKKAAKEAYLRGLPAAPDDAIVVKLADRASNVQTLRNLPLPKQHEYYAQTVAYIMPLAATRTWWAAWYTTWQEAHRDLA